MANVDEVRVGLSGVRWQDYVGVAAADDAVALAGRPSLYELAQVDREVWQIVGVEFTQTAGVLGATVLVVLRGPAGARPEESRDADGQIPVTAITVGTGVAELMREAFETISVRLMGGEWAGESIRVDQTITQVQA